MQIQGDNNISGESQILESEDCSDRIDVCKTEILDLAKRIYKF